MNTKSVFQRVWIALFVFFGSLMCFLLGKDLGRFTVRQEAIKLGYAHWEINTNYLPRVEAIFTWNTNRN